MRARELLVALAAVLAGAGAVWLAANGGPERPTEPGPALTLLVGVSLIGSGLASWRARPENRLGPAMIVTGFAWFAALLSESSSAALYTAGTALEYAFIAGYTYLILSFPSGRLETRRDRTLVAATLGLALGLPIVAMLFGNHTGLKCGDRCPDNLLQLFHHNRVALALLNLQRLFGAVLIAVALAVLVARWLQASAASRRAVAPVMVAGAATFVALIATIIDDLAGTPLKSGPAEVFFYVSATVPVAITIVFLQRRLARGEVAGLVVQLGARAAATELRAALARALGDPSLELAFWYPGDARYVTGDGQPVELPERGSDRAATCIERDGTPIAVLLHDPALEDNAELVQSVCAAAGLALENERLQAELRARLADLQASRARLVEATDAERRRIERDLHDGTQQRLVSIAMALGLLESRLSEPAAAAPLVRETRDAIALALAELRELTQGIHPALLAERGLPAALDELCRRAPLPTRLHAEVEGRLSDQVESAAYFVVSEALTNAAKHSHGREAQVGVRRDGDLLILEVADDGIGGAAPGGGSGLRGLADRVEALGGRMTLSSPPGRGTTLRAEIPCQCE
jgi:signal transduction histidine kinase